MFQDLPVFIGYKRAGSGVLGPRQTKEDGLVLRMGLGRNRSGWLQYK